MMDLRAAVRANVITEYEAALVGKAYTVDPKGGERLDERELDWVGRLALNKLRDWNRLSERCGK